MTEVNPKASPEESPNERPSKISKTLQEEGDSSEEEEEKEAVDKSMKPGLRRYLVAVEYIGTRFCGSQQQLNHRTVVGVLQVLFFLLRIITQLVFLCNTSKL
jgi:tRNA pseudouridine38-40 synthase